MANIEIFCRGTERLKNTPRIYQYRGIKRENLKKKGLYQKIFTIKIHISKKAFENTIVQGKQEDHDGPILLTWAYL